MLVMGDESTGCTARVLRQGHGEAGVSGNQLSHLSSARRGAMQRGIISAMGWCSMQ